MATSTNYVIYTDTATDSAPNMDSYMYVSLQGDQGKSDVLYLDDPHRNDFEPGKTDDFPFTLNELGNLKTIHIDVRQSRPWHLLQVRVQKKNPDGTVAREWSAYSPDSPSGDCWFNQNGSPSQRTLIVR